ncbi:MAG: hypothetical protein ACAI44_29735 [Candidatus Sericytochromatia bacterium]
MPSVTSSSARLDLAFVLDKNQNGTLQVGQEINISPEELDMLDGNHDKQLSTDELSTALAKDFVSVEYKTNQPTTLRLNPVVFRAHSNDKAQGYIYGGCLLGAGVGAGVGALIAMGTGASPRDGAGLGGLIGGVAGSAGAGVYSYFNNHPTTTYQQIDPAQEPDPKAMKKYTLGGAAVGAGVGAALGAFGLARLGILSKSTSIFVGTTIGATIGMGIGNAIGSSHKVGQPDQP